MIDLIAALNLTVDRVWAVGADVALKATLLFLVALLLHRLLRAHHPVACSSIWNAYLVGLALLPLAAVACPRLRIECLPPDLAVTEASPPADTSKTVYPAPAPMHGETAHSADWQFEQTNDEPFVPAQETQIPHETAAGQQETFAVSVAKVPAPGVPWQLVQWKTWFLATYFIGVMIAAVRLALSFRAVKSLRRSSVALTEPSWMDVLRGWCRRLAIGRIVRLAHSGEIGTAIVLGWLRPVIVVPSAMLSAITPGQRNVILVHELAHIRRADFAWQWLLRVLQVVYWLHPLCWVTDRAIRSVRERICDDFCVHWLGNRREYGTALVDLAGTMARRQRGLALGLAAVRSSKIEQRLAHIDQSAGCLRCRPRWQFRTLLMGVAAGLTILLGSVELCRVNLTAGEVAAERTEPLTVAAEPSDKSPVTLQPCANCEGVLTVAAEPLDRLPTQLNQAPAGTGDPGTETFIVSFKGIDPFRPQTNGELLNGFVDRHKGGARTHHFRTTKKDQVLIGHICVDGKAGKDSLVSLLAQSDRVTLVDCKEATPDVLERHMVLGHASLRTNRAGQSAATATRAKPTYPEDEASLRFELFDAFGRKVHSDDYLGAPVLILAGGCWCGGCQADAERVRVVEEKYRARGLQVIRSVSWDGELPAWEFQKHYRLPFVQLLDPIREFEKRYNRDGWTFLMLADGEGRIVYRGNSGNLDYSHVEGLLDTLLARRSAVETVSRDGISYMPATLKRSGESVNPRPDDRFASVACSAEGRRYIAFTTNRGGTQDIYLREFDGQEWLPDRPVAATEADEFDGTVIVDRENRVWVSWTSNAGGSHYDVFVACTSDSSSTSAPPQVTHSDDDAMHARMASDAQGRIWVTYFKWHKINGRSRDKEVYARYLEDDRWSDEIRVSPTDVSEAEDHFDPVIAAHEDGVIVGWSWDFHPPNSSGYSPVSKLPSIFLRTVGPAAELGPVRAVSGSNADTRPAIAQRWDGRICCVWESALSKGGSAPGYQKMITGSVEDLQRDQQPGLGTNLTSSKRNICTPCLAASPSGDVASVWSEVDAQGRWKLRLAILDGRTNRWTQPKTVVSNDHNARFPAVAFDADGRLWIAYSAETGAGRVIQIVKYDVTVDLDRQSQRPGDQSPATAAQSTPGQRLSQAREALRGKDKNTRLAQDLLLDLAANHALEFEPLDRCHLYVYLGYIEDLAGNRKAAVGWHEKALAIEGLQGTGIRKVAELGKSEPVVWLRHLDQNVPAPSRDASKVSVIERIGEAVITSRLPADPTRLKMELSTDERLENFDLLWQAIDRNYSFFEHKGIDWQEVKERYRPKAEAAKTGEDYYRVMYDLVRQLGDAHSRLPYYRQQVEPPRFSPPISTDRIEGKAVITSVEESLARSFKGLQPGSVITHVDGMTVADKVEQLRPLIKTCSSDRNFLKVAHRQILHGELGSKVRLNLLPPNGKIPVEVELERSQEAMRNHRVPDFPIRKGKFIHSGVHPSGCGYIRILSFKGRMEIADEFDDALENLKDTPALMIDIRENPGGFGTSQPRIMGRFVTERTKVLLTFRKTGPGHRDLLPREHYVVPSGNWQYTKPVALLLNEITGSASDIFACQMLGTGRPIAVGTTTHGSSAGTGAYVLLPCGLVARVSNGYTSDVNGRIIEGNGNVPRIRAELTINDVANGTDSVVDRAVRAMGHQPDTGA